jgi:thymidylate kinase
MAGCGKTTIATMLVDTLAARGDRAVLLREKDFDPFRATLRTLKQLRGTHQMSVPDRTLAAELSEARAVVHKEVLLLILDRGEWVLLDRSFLTDAVTRTAAVEDFLSALSMSESAGARRPDKLFLFVGSPEVCAERIRRRGRLEGANTAHSGLEERLQVERTKYLWTARWMGQVCVIDGDGSSAAQLSSVLACIDV